MNGTPTRRLTCCVCGEPCQGRQWWNRDTGYGLCQACGDTITLTHGAAEAEDMAGKRGVHWDIKDDKP